MFELEPSYFDIFLKQTANIPEVWENIITKLSVIEVANCLKVNRGLKSALTRCLTSNSRLQNIIDTAVVASAISKERFKSIARVIFGQKCNISGWCLVIDGEWHYMKGRRDPTDFTILHPVPGQGRGRRVIRSEETRRGKPSCARYKLSWKKDPVEDEDAGDVFITIYDAKIPDKKMAVKDMMLYKFDNCRKIRHLGSDEQAKVTILLPQKMIVVHDATTGDKLWRHEFTTHYEADKYRYLLPFMTKNYCGYVTERENPREESFCTFHFLDASSGDFVGSIKSQGRPGSTCENIFVQANFVLYLHGASMSVQVIKVTGKKVTRHNIPLPIDQLMQIADEGKSLPRHEYIIYIMGFLGKSNVLLGKIVTLMGKCHLFSLNVDAAVSAMNKDEMNSAFTHLFTSCYGRHWPEDKLWPLYRSDRAKQCAELVGVAREIEGTNSDKRTFESYLFVTEMQLSTEF